MPSQKTLNLDPKKNLNIKIAFFITLIFELTLFLKFGNFTEIVPFWNDNINLALPNRVYLDNALSSGQFPFYDFLSGAGVPFLSIYTSSGMSPLTLLIAIFLDYSITALLIEVLLLNLITFTGMYFFIKKISNEYIALLAATTFVLSSYFVGQATANIEALGTTAGLPWAVLGLLNIYDKNRIGVFQFAAALGFAFTHGYLGLNILISVLLMIGILFFVIEKILFYQKQIQIDNSDLKKTVKYFFSGVILFLGAILLLLTETLTNTQKNLFLDREINPFTASMKFESWKTLFDPLVVRNQPPDVYGGFYSNLYVTLPFLLGLLAFFVFGSKYRVSSLLLIFISYFSILPENNPIARLLVSLLPGFDLIRFHSWASILIVFLILSFGSTGLLYLYQRTFIKKEIVLISFLCALVISLQIAFSITFKYLVISLLFFAILLASIYLSKINKLAKSNMWLSIYVCLFIVVSGQIAFADRRIGDGGTPFSIEEQKSINEIAKSGLTSWPVSDLKRQGVFSVLGQYPNELVGNQQMYFNIPVAVSYTPQMNPLVLEANVGRGLRTLEPLLVNNDFSPINYTAKFKKPNEIVFNLNEEINSSAIIQFTYSSNFYAVSNGMHKKLKPTDENFIKIRLNPEDRVVVLRYEPKLVNLQFLIVFISWTSIVYGLVKNSYPAKK